MTQYPGYTLLRTEPCPEQHGTLTVLTHDVSGASVLLVENDDNNKAFGIGFGTFPSDDTGVFHILEHSVLAGSEKYPVKSPFLQLMKSSMASFINAMTFRDKTVYPFATPNETDYRNLMDVYLNAVFHPLAMVDRSVFEQEGWHREPDGTISGVVYNEMQGALADPEQQLYSAMLRALYPDTGYGFESGGDPASIPGLTYEQFVKTYRRFYRADNCCIVLYGKMDMADKLAFLDREYLSGMPKGKSHPALGRQFPQQGVSLRADYVTETPETQQIQSMLGWYTGDFADQERQLAVEILLDALMSTNQSPLKQLLLEEKLGADVDVGFMDSFLQPFLVLSLKGTDEASAARFARCVQDGVRRICSEGIPQELLLASLNKAEFESLERPGNLPDGVAAAIQGVTGWLHTGDPARLLHTNALFESLRTRLSDGWFDRLLEELFAPAPVQVTLVPTLPVSREEAAAVRTDGKLEMDHPLTVADLGAAPAVPAGAAEALAGLELLHHPSAGSTYLNFYYDLGGVAPEDMPYLRLMADLLDELDSERHTARELTTLRSTWLGESSLALVLWTGRQEGSPCHAKLALRLSLLERSLKQAVELAAEWLYETRLSGPAAQEAFRRVLSQNKLAMEQRFLNQGNSYAAIRASAHFAVESACRDRCAGVEYYRFLCGLLEQADWEGLSRRLEALRGQVLSRAALTVSLHGSEAALEQLRTLLPASAFAAADRAPARAYVEPLPAPVNEAFVIEGGVSYDVLAWPMKNDSSRKVLAQVMTYEYLWHCIREVGGAYGTGMESEDGVELLFTYRDPHVKGSYQNFAQGPAALSQREYDGREINDFIVGTVSGLDKPRKPHAQALELDRRWFCGVSEEMAAQDRAAVCAVDAAQLKAQVAGLAGAMEGAVRCVFGSREAVERARTLFDRVEKLV